MTDRELIAMYFARSERAVEETQRQYGAYCRTIAGRLLTDPRDVEECVSDCWLLVWNAIPPTCPQHFKGWLGAIVRNRALVICKTNDRRPPVVDETVLELAAVLPGEDAAYRAVEAGELGRAISAFLYTQKKEQRTAFVLRYWYMGSVEEVARRMGWTPAKTKSVLFRMRNKLRDYLQKEGYWNEG